SRSEPPRARTSSGGGCACDFLLGSTRVRTWTEDGEPREGSLWKLPESDDCFKAVDGPSGIPKGPPGGKAIPAAGSPQASSRTAQNLNWGILPYGSSSSMVSTLAAASRKWNGMKTLPGVTARPDASFQRRPDAQAPGELSLNLAAREVSIDPPAAIPGD